MNLSARLKKIENKMTNGTRETVWINECKGEYYIEKNGEKVVIKNPEVSFPTAQIFIEVDPL